MSTAPRNSAGWTHACTRRTARPAEDLVDVTALLEAYDAITPDVTDPAQGRRRRIRQGHRGSSLDGAFNAGDHPDDLRGHGKGTGPLQWAGSSPRLADRAGGAGRQRRPSTGRLGRPAHPDAGRLTRDPEAEPGGGQRRRADGIVVTPSHNPPRDGGFKYNPPRRPSRLRRHRLDRNWANELIAANLAGVRRVPFERARAAAGEYDFVAHYVDDLPQVLNLDKIRSRPGYGSARTRWAVRASTTGPRSPATGTGWT